MFFGYSEMREKKEKLEISLRCFKGTKYGYMRSYMDMASNDTHCSCSQGAKV